ncbi:MAG: hypothetical protein RL594_1 [Bacteroidota bacterium]|jgi:hypothetical protein
MHVRHPEERSDEGAHVRCAQLLSYGVTESRSDLGTRSGEVLRRYAAQDDARASLRCEVWGTMDCSGEVLRRYAAQDDARAVGCWGGRAPRAGGARRSAAIKKHARASSRGAQRRGTTPKRYALCHPEERSDEGPLQSDMHERHPEERSDEGPHVRCAQLLSYGITE